MRLIKLIKFALGVAEKRTRPGEKRRNNPSKISSFLTFLSGSEKVSLQRDCSAPAAAVETRRYPQPSPLLPSSVCVCVCVCV